MEAIEREEEAAGAWCLTLDAPNGLQPRGCAFDSEVKANGSTVSETGRPAKGARNETFVSIVDSKRRTFEFMAMSAI
jgi:hypothetical protein